MKHLKRFENFDQSMVHSSEYPSVEDMKAYVCGCGYDEMEVEEMTYSEVCSAYDTCKMESNESRRYRRYESFDMEMMHDMNENPSEEEMMDYLCSCGYNEMDVMEMDFHELCNAYEEESAMEANEARKYKRKAPAKKAPAKKAKPDFLDLDKDGDKKETMKKAYADKKAAQGKGTQKDKDEAQKKTQSQAQGKLSAAQKKLPPALQKAIMDKKK